MTRLRQTRLFFVALQFLTRLPAPRWVGFEAEWLNASARYFPLIGTLVGMVAAVVLWGAEFVFPASVAAGLSIAATLLLTGAFHEDGLADTCDALGGKVSRERALEIMKDSRIGTYGALALVVALGIKAAALAALLPTVAVPAYVLAHTASRAAPVLLIRWLPYAGHVEQAKAKPLAQSVTLLEVAIALLWTAIVCAALLWLQASSLLMIASGLVATGLVVVCSAFWLRSRLGGYTGDTLGATQQVSELLVLLASLATARLAT